MDFKKEMIINVQPFSVTGVKRGKNFKEYVSYPVIFVKVFSNALVETMEFAVSDENGNLVWLRSDECKIKV